ncbi:glycosyltransferase [Staphylococcus hominis]|uniref:glycosyltransferase n=1 Tax=Staphylococcus hominis TaxID=1290 RepID=UPI00398B87D5|nr:glycosyltransferase [Staphylococcus hominis]
MALKRWISELKCLILSVISKRVLIRNIIEAMLLKKPVIAFDVKYGPSDFIRDKENGYLIDNKNIEEMSKKFLKY